jgi:hypothetical protein
MSGASVAAEHKRRRFVRPAFKDIRATRFLTNRVQIQTVNQFQNGILIRRIADADFQPVGFFQTLAVFSVDEILD